MAAKELPQIFPHAAGIDIGTRELHVSTDGETVKVFDTFSGSLNGLVVHLKEQQVKSVAMEATGVLWLPLYDVIEQAGFEVYLVNATHAKNIPAQKSDFKDCRWLQKVHSYGFLRKSFVPKEDIRALRSLMRLRDDHIEMASQHLQHIQKAFELMNIKLHNVITDIKGVSGIKIIEAIIKGEYVAEQLAELCDPSILLKKRTLVTESLRGNFKPEYLFMMKQGYELYQVYQNKIQECDQQIEMMLKEMTKDLPEPVKTSDDSARHNHPNIENLHTMTVQLNNGNNASVLPGFTDKTVLKLISELGLDLSQWASEKHFTSWLGLSPWKRQSGKMNRTKFCPAKTLAGQIFRESALSIANSKHIALKGFYNRIKSKHGVKAAIKATARKLATLYYRAMTKGLNYVEEGLVEYEKKYQEKYMKNFTKKAAKFGCQLVPINN